MSEAGFFDCLCLLFVHHPCQYIQKNEIRAVK